jgi:hypothetical protein
MLWAVCKVFRGLFAIERVLGLSTVPLHDAFLKLTALTLKRDGERFPIVVGSPKTSSILFEQFGVFAHQGRINRVIRYVTEQNLAEHVGIIRWLEFAVLDLANVPRSGKVDYWHVSRFRPAARNEEQAGERDEDGPYHRPRRDTITMNAPHSLQSASGKVCPRGLLLDKDRDLLTLGISVGRSRFLGTTEARQSPD